MYNTNEWAGKRMWGFTFVGPPYFKISNKGWKRKYIKVYCSVCGSVTEQKICKLKAREIVACSLRCTRIHIRTLPIDYWEDNEMDLEKYITYLVHQVINKREMGKGINKEHIKPLCDLYEQQSGKCSLLHTRMYLGKNTHDRYRTASLDRIDNLLYYTVMENNRWIHKELNDMLNCMNDKRLFQFSNLLVERDKIISQKI